MWSAKESSAYLCKKIPAALSIFQSGISHFRINGEGFMESHPPGIENKPPVFWFTPYFFSVFAILAVSFTGLYDELAMIYGHFQFLCCVRFLNLVKYYPTFVSIDY